MCIYLGHLMKVIPETCCVALDIYVFISLTSYPKTISHVRMITSVH